MGDSSPELRILALCGSLRRDSLNKRIIQRAAALTAPAAEVRVFEHLAEVPYFSEEIEDPPPASVTELRAAVRSSHALLIATPEYNGSFPGVLKNVIDWLSRPDGRSPILEDLPVALISASVSRFGGIRAQLACRQVLQKVGAHVLPQPEFALGQATARSTDPTAELPGPAEEILRELMRKLVDSADRRQAATSS